MKREFKSSRRIKGQGMTEYIVVVAVVALGAVGAYSYFGKTVRNQTAAIASGLAGNKTDAENANKAAAAAAVAGKTDAATARGLSTFADGVEGK